MTGRAWCVAAVAAGFAWAAEAGERRDIVFDCPCAAEWVAGEEGEPGTLILTGGIRSLRATASGEIRLAVGPEESESASLGRLPAGGRSQGEWRVALAEPEPGAVVELDLDEAVGAGPDGAVRWHRQETLALWPVPKDGAPAPVGFVDILTDADGDGFGDLNERLAGTSWDDSGSHPGVSVVDVLAFFSAEFREAEGGYPHARMLHELTVAGAVFEDSGTDIRLRIVGIVEAELDEYGWVVPARREELMGSYGADVSIQAGGPCNCAGVGASNGSRWRDADAAVHGGAGSALVTAHELGHVMGLAHSARQGETYGAFRWSRGHYLTPVGRASNAASAHGFGTVMTYGDHRLSGVFSSPLADCGDVPCGVSREAIDGADAVDTLDLLRFQIAAHRDPAPDSDGDGFVDAGDALPDDPDDWFDADGDGIGDNADPDDDNDGTPDAEDPFPVDPGEWADADGDGVGDNSDADVADLSPFRDPSLRAAVERELDKAPGEAITRAEMASLSELSAGWEEIADLTGLELATGLRHLDLHYNGIADLSPLAGLASLASLDLRSNRVTDLSPLAGLSALASLVLAENPVDDISALAGLAHCLSLDLDDTGVAFDDVRALPYFPRIRNLGLAGLGITDLSELAELPLESLGLARNPLSDLAPLARMTSLARLDLSDTGLRDVGPLAALADLEWLGLGGNGIADLDPLGGLEALRVLRFPDNHVTDLAPLEALAHLEVLDFDRNVVADLAPLAGMPELWLLQAAGNRITDLEALSGLEDLHEVDLAHNAITDIAPLAGKTAMRSLALTGNAVEDLSALSGMANLWSLLLDGNAVSDIAPVGDLANLTTLAASGNRIADLAPLSRLGALQWLDLSHNAVSDIGPIADRSVFGGSDAAGAFVELTGNPLDETSLDDHISALEAWGVHVRFDGPGVPVEIADPTLRSVVAEAVAGQVVHVDDVSGWPMSFLTELRLMGRGVASLAGLDAASALDSLYAAANRIADLTPLAGLRELSRLDLRDNRISDLSPLVANAGLAEGDWLALSGNPLSEESLNVHIPALLVRGVEVSVERVIVVLVAGGEARRFDTSGYFEARLGTGATLAVSVVDSTLATAEVADGVLVLTPGTTLGTTTATVTATATDGSAASLDFVVDVRGPARAPLVGDAMDPVRQGFVRVVNHGPEAGTVRVSAFDDAGNRRDGPAFALASGEAVHMNSAELETGNPEKGLTGGTGRGIGDWRLQFETTLDIEVLTYVRTADGFLRSMQDVAAATGNGWEVPTFNPASNAEQVSSLRLSNLGAQDAEAVVKGVDDRGESPGSDVRVEIPAGATVTLSAEELENGSARARGRLGDGRGKWRLVVASRADLAVASLLSGPDGHLSNLSSGPIRPDGEGVVTVPLFPSAGLRQGFVRVANRSDADGEVRIDAYDDLGRRYEPLTLAVDARNTVHFNSDDLELGNPDKGLSGRTGRGSGEWRLEMRSALDIDVLAYVRTPGGILAAMHDTVPREGRRYEVATFHSGNNTEQVSMLRIVNLGVRPAHVSIAGIDDAGTWRGDVVRLTVDPGAVRTILSAELEQGAWGLDGKLGDGTGKWRLRIDCEREVLVMNLLSSPNGHLANLSTTASP